MIIHLYYQPLCQAFKKYEGGTRTINANRLTFNSPHYPQAIVIGVSPVVEAIPLSEIDFFWVEDSDE